MRSSFLKVAKVQFRLLYYKFVFKLCKNFTIAQVAFKFSSARHFILHSILSPE
uniref:Uncharacterized protein n=1 Tax=Arundo donax TaxID=35708 RepID=A0A0A8YYL4_ARUDO